MPNITALGDITGRSVSSCEWVRNDARRLSTEVVQCCPTGKALMFIRDGFGPDLVRAKNAAGDARKRDLGAPQTASVRHLVPLFGKALRPVTLLTHLRPGSLHRLRGSGSGRSGAHA